MKIKHTLKKKERRENFEIGNEKRLRRKNRIGLNYKWEKKMWALTICIECIAQK